MKISTLLLFILFSSGISFSSSAQESNGGKKLWAKYGAVKSS